MKNKLVFILLFITIQAFSQNKMSESITISNGFIRMMPPMMNMTAAFMDIQNSSSNTVKLVKVTSSLSDTAELHSQTIRKNGSAAMMKMKEIIINKDSTHELKLGGDHVMIIGLNKKLKTGDLHTLTFYFSDGSSKEKSIMVKRL